MDEKNTIGVEYLKAALAVWDYADETAKYVFGSATGDPARDSIVAALKGSDRGLTRTNISALLGRHVKADHIDRVLADLSSSRLAYCESVETEGRPKEVWRWS